MKIKAVIFDLDGTLLNTLDDLNAAINHALAAVGFKPLTYEETRAFVGNGVPRLVERALVYAAGGDIGVCESPDFVRPEKYDACMRAFTEFYDIHSADRTRLYDGVSDALKTLKAKSYKIAVVTNKYDAAAQKLKARFFPEADAVVGTSDNVRPKPATDGVDKALELIGADRAHAVYVGDGETDIAMAKNCGMPVIAVTWGFRNGDFLKSLDPDKIADTPAELEEAITVLEETI